MDRKKIILISLVIIMILLTVVLYMRNKEQEPVNTVAEVTAL